MKTLRLKKHLCSGGAAVALCALALAAHARSSNVVMGLNPALYYHLNDTTPVPGSLWSNAGTAGPAGTLFGLNTPGFQQPGAIVADSDNYAAGFTGTSIDAYAPIPYSPAVDPSKGNPKAPFTAEGWFNPGAGTPADTCVLSWANLVSPYTGWVLYQDATNGWDWRLYKNSGTNIAGEITSGSANPLNVGTFYHVALVWDGTNATMYTNGVATGPPLPVPLFVPQVPTRIVSVGCSTSFGAFWKGLADEVTIYTNALSAATILAHYQNGTNSSPSQTYASLVLASAPLLYYRFSDPPYTDPTPGVIPGPFQSGQPTAQNLGSLGTPGYDATYEAGTAAGVPGAPYAGFGSNSYAVEINGIGDTTDYSSVQIPALAGLTSVTNLTFTCWFYNNSPQNTGNYGNPLFWQRATTKGKAGVATGVWIYHGTNLEEMFNNDDFGTSFGTPGIGIPPQGAWSFVACVWTPTNATIYVNAVGRSIASTHLPVNLDFAQILLGIDIDNGNAVNGLMQEAALFTNALSEAEIQSLYNAGGQPPSVTSVTQTPAGPTNYEGQTITFSQSSYGSGTLAYQWLKNSQALNGQTAATLVLTNVVVANSGSYSVVVSTTYGAATSSVVALDVVAGPPLISQQPAPATATRSLNGDVTFTALALGTLPISYQWQFGSTPISGATAASLTLTALQTDNAGSYKVVATNPHGSVTSSNAVLTVTQVATNFASAVVALGPQAYWRLNETSGTNAFDYVGGNTGTIVGGVALDQAGAPYPGLNSTNAAFDFGINGVVDTPLLIDGNQGTFMAMIDVTNQTYEPGIMVARGGTGIPYPLPGTAYNLSDYSACCGFATSVDGVSLSYQWADQNNTFDWDILTYGSPLQLTPNTWCFVAISVGPNQTIIYLDGGSGLQAETNNVPSVGVTNTGPLLIGYDPIKFSGQPAPYFNGGIGEAAYFNRALSPAEVTALDQTLFSGAPLGAPNITDQPVPQTVLLGSTATFTASATGALPLNYQWQYNDANIPGATEQTLVIPGVDYTYDGSYRVIVSNSISASNSQPAQLTVLEPPMPGNVSYGLVGHYKFDGDCTDSSGNGNNGFGENSPVFTNGVIGSGAIQVYDNQTHPYAFQYVNLGDPAGFQFNAGQSFSVSLWLNYTGTPGNLPIIGNAGPTTDAADANATGQLGWVLTDSYFDDGGGNITCSLHGPNNSEDVAYFQATNQVGAGVMNDGNWHHLVLVNNQNNNVISLYADGVLANSTAFLGLGSLNTGFPIVIGNDPTGIYASASGPGGYSIDDVGIWNRPLSSAEVTGIYAAGTNGASFDSYGPVQLTVKTVSGGQLQLSWQQGTLESATNVAGPWTNVLGATPPVYLVAPGGGKEFYRVQ